MNKATLVGSLLSNQCYWLDFSLRYPFPSTSAYWLGNVSSAQSFHSLRCMHALPETVKIPIKILKEFHARKIPLTVLNRNHLHFLNAVSFRKDLNDFCARGG